MGAYLSEPVTTKLSNDESNEKLECGASSMQGWRVNQEDAHNTILDYDENTSYFAVYDGHGGAEVATYCSQRLPNFIKETEAYKSGNIEKALEDAFLGFDESIASKEVMAVLKEMAGEVNPPPTADEMEDSEEDENVSNLFQEAKLPLQEVLAKYESKFPFKKKLLGDGTTPLSPFLRAKASKHEEEGGGPSGSSRDVVVEPNDMSAASSSAGNACAGASSSSLGASSSSGYVSESSPPGPSSSTKKTEEEGVSSSTTYDADKGANGEVSTSAAETDPLEVKPKKDAQSAPDSSEDNCELPESSENVKVKDAACNGEVTESVKNVEESDISSSQNGENKGTSGKAKDKLAGSVSSTEEPKFKSKRSSGGARKASIAAYSSLLAAQADSDDESDSNDETFHTNDGRDSSEEEEVANGVSDSDDEAEGELDEVDDEDDDDEEDTSDDLDEEEDISMTEEPGADSGCTAVVALLKGNDLYVANAGDSRCIVCRNGKAVDMSLDHKPEDEVELTRIQNAGGKVTSDGRINGGLNLSRAIGDHSYKQNKELNAREQMITALPDVKKLTIDPSTDEFMVLACDGIWNFMSSQDVCDFILPRLAQPVEKLSHLCEEMFDHCLAPSTMGDGTGCDNMTAIIVRFKKSADGTKTETDTISVSTSRPSAKRTAEDDQESDSKRQRVEDTLSSSVVTSSV